MTMVINTDSMLQTLCTDNSQPVKQNREVGK